MYSPKSPPQRAASARSSRSSGARSPDESASWRSGYAASQSRRRTASRPASRGDSRTWLMLGSPLGMLQTLADPEMATRILIVDDQDIRKLLGHRLKADGFEPIFAGDAISAVNQARKEQPDLILLDLMLPAGDGYVVMERLKAMPALEGIPVIVISALDPRSQEDKFDSS